MEQAAAKDPEKELTEEELAALVEAERASHTKKVDHRNAVFRSSIPQLAPAPYANRANEHMGPGQYTGNPLGFGEDARGGVITNNSRWSDVGEYDGPLSRFSEERESKEWMRTAKNFLQGPQRVSVPHSPCKIDFYAPRVAPVTQTRSYPMLGKSKVARFGAAHERCFQEDSEDALGPGQYSPLYPDKWQRHDLTITMKPFDRMQGVARPHSMFVIPKNKSRRHLRAIAKATARDGGFTGDGHENEEEDEVQALVASGGIRRTPGPGEYEVAHHLSAFDLFRPADGHVQRSKTPSSSFCVPDADEVRGRLPKRILRSGQQESTWKLGTDARTWHNGAGGSSGNWGASPCARFEQTQTAPYQNRHEQLNRSTATGRASLRSFVMQRTGSLDEISGEGGEDEENYCASLRQLDDYVSNVLGDARKLREQRERDKQREREGCKSVRARRARHREAIGAGLPASFND